MEYTYNHYGNITSMTDSEGQSVSYGYDDLQRLASVNTDGFSKSFTYTDGLPSLITYKLDNTVIASERRGYSCGTLSRVTLGDTTVIWQLDAQNGRGLPGALSNSALETALDYDGDNRVIDRYVTLKANPNIEVSSQLYSYSGTTGNMEGRGAESDDEEEFTYDALQRLTGYGGCKSVTYDLIGNIVQKSDIGSLEYDGTPYAFTFLTDTAMVMPATTQTIAYNALQLPDTINEGGYRATFMYYGDGTRSRMTLGNNNGTMQVQYYDGQFNRYHRYEGNVEYTKDILWLGGTPYTAPAALMRVSDGPVPGGDNWRLYYVMRDNQRSIVAVTDSAGNTLQALRYDPWGNILDNADGHMLTRGEQPELLLERGYTGHEHLPQFGLINMNARLYEPLTARFLSPDPEVQAPDFSQNLNRYSYCLNNPLRYIDPTGEGWMRTQYFDEIFWLYRADVNNQDDVYKIYGQDANLVYMGNFINIKYIDGETGDVLERFLLGNDGSIMNGGGSFIPDFNDGCLHIGNFHNVVFGELKDYNDLKMNWLDYHYLGPNNPQYDNERYCYSIAPRNTLDYFARIHDQDYDALDAENYWGVLSGRTSLADFKLSNLSFFNSLKPMMPAPIPDPLLMYYMNPEQHISTLTSTFFGLTVILKNSNAPTIIYNIMDYIRFQQ